MGGANFQPTRSNHVFGNTSQHVKAFGFTGSDTPRSPSAPSLMSSWSRSTKLPDARRHRDLATAVRG
jgi:hypothetical protein